jgi:hypothetical protein
VAVSGTDPARAPFVCLPGVGIPALGFEEVGTGVLGAGAGLECGDHAAEAFEVGVDGRLAAGGAGSTSTSH